MAPEYGASSGFFPVDDATLTYLRTTGRPDDLIARVEVVAKAQGLWFDPAAAPRYTTTLEIDLAAIGPNLAGPRRPQDRVTAKEVRGALERSLGRPLEARPDGPIPDGAVAIAAITSCTNTTDPALLIRAGLLARRARELGLSPPRWVKTSLAPGSPAARRYLERSGLLDDLEAVGFGIVGFGCTTCIGNSGPLQSEMEAAIRGGTAAAAVLSGNRNFPGRVHPLLQDGFLASPPMVVAFALAGDLRRDIEVDPIGRDRDGREVRLADLWPGDEEVAQHLRTASEPDDYGAAFATASANKVWRDLAAPSSPQFPWDARSTYLRRPIFASRAASTRLGTFEAEPLLVVGDDITTDHISPAGQISPASYAGRYLVEHGEQARDLNVYASRRGNWEVMVRGLFDNRSVRNMLAPDAPTGSTIHVPSGRVAALWDIAQDYRRDGTSVVIVAGERYGTGSSRDWAAKGAALLGVRAVLARSFERIHRSNLVSMGILPVLLPPSASPQTLDLRPGDRILVEAHRITPRGDIPFAVLRSDGRREEHMGRAAVETQVEVGTLEAGGIIPLILSEVLTEDRGFGLGSTAA
jgi:aconitate hydratase